MASLEDVMRQHENWRQTELTNIRTTAIETFARTNDPDVQELAALIDRLARVVETP